jgi:hypothetical protein
MMEQTMVDVLMHIDENTTHTDRENLRDKLLSLDGVMSADYHDEKPHLIMVLYNPDIISSMVFVNTAKSSGLHAELISL